MPKDLVPPGWVQKPCMFRQQSSQCCELCERPFSWFNSSRHCAYCGRVFHRKDCSSRNGLGAHRACAHCSDYRTHLRDMMIKGEEFVCVDQGQEVRLSLCEETAELVLHWTDLNLKETSDLLQVELRKGFTRPGPPITSQRPGPPITSQRPGPPIISQRPGPPIISQRPGLPLTSQRPGPPIISQRPGPPITSQRPGPPITSQRPGPPIISQRPGLPLISQCPGPPLISQRPGPPLFGDYEPLKSMSLVINNSKILALKSSSAWTCQLWVDGLKSAQYVYGCMLQQERTRHSYLDRGVAVRSRWFTNYYLVAADPTPPTITPSPNTSTHRPSSHTITRLTPPTGCTTSRLPAPRVPHLVDSGYSSDLLSSPHQTRPWKVKGHKGSSVQSSALFMSYPHTAQPSRPHTRSSSHPHTQHSYPSVWNSHGTPPWSSQPHTTHSPHRLPYQYSPLSELCHCHDYEIIPSRSVDVHEGGAPPTPGPRCCGDCVETCRVAQDLDNL